MEVDFLLKLVLICEWHGTWCGHTKWTGIFRERYMKLLTWIWPSKTEGNSDMSLAYARPVC